MLQMPHQSIPEAQRVNNRVFADQASGVFLISPYALERAGYTPERAAAGALS